MCSGRNTEKRYNQEADMRITIVKHTNLPQNQGKKQFCWDFRLCFWSIVLKASSALDLRKALQSGGWYAFSLGKTHISLHKLVKKEFWDCLLVVMLFAQTFEALRFELKTVPETVLVHPGSSRGAPGGPSGLIYDRIFAIFFEKLCTCKKLMTYINIYLYIYTYIYIY